jgi:predicted Zn-dependent peptidase
MDAHDTIPQQPTTKSQTQTQPQQPSTKQSSKDAITDITNKAMIYFVPPVTDTFMLWGENIMILLFIALLFFIILIYYVYVNLNEYSTRISVISYASLFGKKPEEMFQYFIRNAQAESIATAMNNIQSTTENINTTTYRLNDQSTLLANQMNKDVPDSNAKSSSLGVSIQKGIAQIQDVVSKLGGAFVLNNYMKQGAVQTTQSPKV